MLQTRTLFLILTFPSKELEGLACELHRRGKSPFHIRIRESAGLLPNTEVEFDFDGSVVRIIPIPPKDGTGRGAEIIRRLWGTSEISMTTDEIVALTRDT